MPRTPPASSWPWTAAKPSSELVCRPATDVRPGTTAIRGGAATRGRVDQAARSLCRRSAGGRDVLVVVDQSSHTEQANRGLARCLARTARRLDEVVGRRTDDQSHLVSEDRLHDVPHPAPARAPQLAQEEVVRLRRPAALDAGAIGRSTGRRALPLPACRCPAARPSGRRRGRPGCGSKPRVGLGNGAGRVFRARRSRRRSPRQHAPHNSEPGTTDEVTGHTEVRDASPPTVHELVIDLPNVSFSPPPHLGIHPPHLLASPRTAVAQKQLRDNRHVFRHGFQTWEAP